MAVALRHRAEAAAYWALTLVCRRIPLLWADRLGRALGWLLARVGRPRWDVVTSQLARAFPNRSAAWRLRTARRCYEHFGAELALLDPLSRLSRREAEKRIEVKGAEHLRGPLQRGEGVILVSGHIGSWELTALGLKACGIPVYVVAARQRNPFLLRRARALRKRLGMRLIDRDERAERLARAALRSGRLLALMADQDARDSGEFVDFFGHPASTVRGPAVLAKRTGARIATGWLLRMGRGDPRYQVRFRPLAPSGEGRDEFVRDITSAFTRRLEAAIVKQPWQYFWHHKRWKTRASAENDAQAEFARPPGRGP